MKTILLVVPFLVFLLRPDPAQANFYQGKTVTIISGTTAGSAYNTYARLIAQHLGKHVPGNPNFIVQNMPSGGSIVFPHFLHKVAQPHGLALPPIKPPPF